MRLAGARGSVSGLSSRLPSSSRVCMLALSLRRGPVLHLRGANPVGHLRWEQNVRPCHSRGPKWVAASLSGLTAVVGAATGPCARATCVTAPLSARHRVVLCALYRRVVGGCVEGAERHCAPEAGGRRTRDYTELTTGAERCPRPRRRARAWCGLGVGGAASDTRGGSGCGGGGLGGESLHPLT